MSTYEIINEKASSILTQCMSSTLDYNDLLERSHLIGDALAAIARYSTCLSDSSLLKLQNELLVRERELERQIKLCELNLRARIAQDAANRY